MSASDSVSGVWRLPVGAAELSTSVVLIADVLGLLVLHQSLRRIGAYLTARRVFDKHESVCISEKWFESFIGQTYGPRWFRWTQVFLKVLFLAASVALSLSLNGNREPGKLLLLNQTVLANKPRTMANHGMGLGRNNFSQSLSFARSFRHCADHQPGLINYFGYRLLVPFTDEYGPYFQVPMECLSEESGFEPHQLYLRNTSNPNLNCNSTISFPTRTDILFGKGNVSAGGECTLTSSSCLAIHHKKEHGVGLENGVASACAAFVTENNLQFLVVAYYYKHETSQDVRITKVLPFRRNNETVAVIARYAAHETNEPSFKLLFMALFQAVPNSSVISLQGSRRFTAIKVNLFLPSVIIAVAIVLGSVVLGLISCCFMAASGRFKYNLGLSASDVAQLADLDHGNGPQCGPWYFKLHPVHPIPIVSTDGLHSGKWEEEEVRDKNK